MDREGARLSAASGTQAQPQIRQDNEGDLLDFPPQDRQRIRHASLLLQAPASLIDACHGGQAQGAGYEIHMGQTHRKGGVSLFQVKARNSVPASAEDGCVSTESNSMGTYIHGIFDNPAITQFWLQHIGLKDIKTSQLEGLEARNREYDLLVEHFKQHIDVEGIMKLVP